MDTYYFNDALYSFDYESPLLTVVNLDDDEMLQILLEQDDLRSKAGSDKSPEELWTGITIIRANEKGTTATVLAIFDTMSAAGFPIDGRVDMKAFYDEVLERAIGVIGVDLDVIRGLLERCPTGHRDHKFSDELYLESCATKNQGLIQLMRDWL